MSGARFALVGLVLLAASSSPGAIAADIGELRWMAGGWGSEADGRWVEEWWTPSRGGLMLGSNRSGTMEKAESFEFFRITQEADGTLAYWAQPGGNPAVKFSLDSTSASEVSFVNSKHDYPQRVAYKKDADGSLVATISRLDGSDQQSWKWMRLTGGPPAKAGASTP